MRDETNERELLRKALELIRQAYAIRSDNNDPFTGGVMNNKEHKRWHSIISKLSYMAGKL